MGFAPGNDASGSKRSIGGSWGGFGGKASASLTTALAGANNDLTYTAVAGLARYATGNSIRVRYVVAGNNTALSVSVTGNDITVNLATDGSGVATSTASAVRTAVNANAAAAALVSAANATGNDGTGVTVAMAFASLTGGRDYVIGTGSAGAARVNA